MKKCDKCGLEMVETCKVCPCCCGTAFTIQKKHVKRCRCGNYVEGKIVQTVGRQMTHGLGKTATGALAQAGGATTGAIIGSIIPGIGTAIGAGIGFLVSTIAKEGMNNAVSETTDELFFENGEYQFACPKCGNTWTEK